ncbi:hypothetical protein Q7P37_005120 [Cladosporium fusiforme]
MYGVSRKPNRIGTFGPPSLPYGTQQPPDWGTQHSGDFEPSVTVREAILERLEKQQDALMEASENVDKLIELGTQASQVDNTRSTGNKQVSGRQLQQVRGRAAMAEGQEVIEMPRRYGRRPKPKHGVFNRPPYALPDPVPYQDRQGFSSLADEFPSPADRPPYRPRGINVKEEVDPMERYERLGREINILVQEFSKGEPGGRDWNPRQDEADHYAAVANPKGAMAARLVKIIGVPGFVEGAVGPGLQDMPPRSASTTGYSARMMQMPGY